MRELKAQTGVPARALEFLIFTACRTGDIIGQRGVDDKPPLKWEHINLGEKLWTIPKPKGQGEHAMPHIVPLARPVVALLEEIKALKLSEIVFPSLQRPRHPLDKRAMWHLLGSMGYKRHRPRLSASASKHGAEEQTNFETKVVEAVLAHGKIADKLEAAYRRGDFFEKRVKLMDAWAEYRHAWRGRTAKVIPLR